MLANVVNLPEINDSPHKNSMDFANGIKYVEAINPIWKALKSPVEVGSGLESTK